ncbi:MAG: Hsp20 family protein [Pseudomonadota bacterium]
MRNALDFTPYRRSMVGFDRLFDVLEHNARATATDSNYPPYDIEKSGDDSYRITIAVAGFTRDEIEVTAHQNLLTVAARKAEPAQGSETPRYVHRGIANRAFERRFQLADYVRVDAAYVADGLLTIDLVREVPEAVKPRKIVLGATTAEAMPQLKAA